MKCIIFVSVIVIIRQTSASSTVQEFFVLLIGNLSPVFSSFFSFVPFFCLSVCMCVCVCWFSYYLLRMSEYIEEKKNIEQFTVNKRSVKHTWQHFKKLSASSSIIIISKWIIVNIQHSNWPFGFDVEEMRKINIHWLFGWIRGLRSFCVFNSELLFFFQIFQKTNAIFIKPFNSIKNNELLIWNIQYATSSIFNSIISLCQ